MADIEATKFYIRHRENYPETEMQSCALHGFQSFGVECVPYYWIDDIDKITDLSPTVGIAGYIGDVMRGLDVLGKRNPPNVDYPHKLLHVLGRNITRGTLYDVRSRVFPVFIKPIEHKLFTGFVYNGDIESRRRIVVL